MSNLFTAKYAGRCDANGCRIHDGDLIAFAEGYDKPLCQRCWQLDQAETSAHPCPSCWTIHAGECL